MDEWEWVLTKYGPVRVSINKIWTSEWVLTKYGPVSI